MEGLLLRGGRQGEGEEGREWGHTYKGREGKGREGRGAGLLIRETEGKERERKGRGGHSPPKSK